MSWLSLLSRLLPSGLPLPIFAGPLRGLWWLVDAAPGPSRGLSVCLGRSEPGQMAAAMAQSQRLMRVAQNPLATHPAQPSPTPVALDIGAHTGVYSLVFASAGLRTFAFEPLPRNLAWLYRTLRVNRISQVTVVPCAVGAKTQLASFAEGEHSSMGKVAASGSQPVAMVGLTEFCRQWGLTPSLIKMDIEGGELECLTSAREFLQACRPVLLLSTHGESIKAQCLQLLAEIGYAPPRPLDAATLEAANEFECFAPESANP